MSDMLKEAIIDAAALREAAKKQAETAVLEAYAGEIKSALNTILEAEEEPFEDPMLDPADPSGGLDDFDFEDDLEYPSQGDNMGDQVPFAYTDDEKLCACPDEDEEVEIDFDELMAQADGGAMDMSFGMDEPMDRDDAAAEMFGNDEEEALFEIDDEVFEELANESQPGWNAGESELGNDSNTPRDAAVRNRWSVKSTDGKGPRTRDLKVNDPKSGPTRDGPFRTNLDHDSPKNAAMKNFAPSDQDRVTNRLKTRNMKEELEADTAGTKSGWAARPTSDLEHEYDQVFARKAHPNAEDKFKDGDYKEDLEGDNEDTLYEQEEENPLEEQLNVALAKNKNLLKESRILRKKGKEYIKQLLEANETLERVNISQAKLFYENKVLRSTSLNERQKKQIAEAISNTSAVEEAKLLYETLKNTVSTSKKKRSGKNPLSEVANKKRTFSSAINGKREFVNEGQQNADVYERMQKLAGLNKKSN